MPSRRGPLNIIHHTCLLTPALILLRLSTIQTVFFDMHRSIVDRSFARVFFSFTSAAGRDGRRCCEAPGNSLCPSICMQKAAGHLASSHEAWTDARRQTLLLLVYDELRSKCREGSSIVSTTAPVADSSSASWAATEVLPLDGWPQITTKGILAACRWGSRHPKPAAAAARKAFRLAVSQQLWNTFAADLLLNWDKHHVHRYILAAPRVVSPFVQEEGPYVGGVNQRHASEICFDG